MQAEPTTVGTMTTHGGWMRKVIGITALRRGCLAALLLLVVTLVSVAFPDAASANMGGTPFVDKKSANCYGNSIYVNPPYPSSISAGSDPNYQEIVYWGAVLFRHDGSSFVAYGATQPALYAYAYNQGLIIYPARGGPWFNSATYQVQHALQFSNLPPGIYMVTEFLVYGSNGQQAIYPSFFDGDMSYRTCVVY